ncbi:GNAT family N-acetyltransferase [Ornithinibacillus sp. L9]|uniref:GNAT family N-acetyltransferase n=1 Tax=Ornithinibacillus caprae TaxID=2678566 RepID=A0A6N8FIH2_9BACI|nr:GNAT family N-acetyltransferase [Ornithinibacillus caprae]MUK89390.1 GNAT family N-acetyltransferase [Ornithinibacillus caprae]
MEQVVTKAFANQLEQSELSLLTSRLEAIENLPDNPMGVEIQDFGKARAFSVKGIPGPSYNTVKGITGDDVGYIEQILAFYKKRDIPARFEITPATSTPELFQQLQRQGFYQHNFHTTLYGSINELHTGLHASVSIRKLKKDEFPIFADIYVRGFSMPDFLKEFVAQNNEVLYENPSWHFYVAQVEGEPVGIGVLHMKDHIGTLAASATVPEFRNRGVHNALVNYRIEQVKQVSCDVIVGQAAFGSTSQLNMQKAGMKIAYTKALWVK